MSEVVVVVAADTDRLEEGADTITRVASRRRTGGEEIGRGAGTRTMEAGAVCVDGSR